MRWSDLSKDFGVQRHTDPGTQPLAQRSRRHVHKRKARSRMAFKIRTQGAQFQQVGSRKQPGFRPRGVEKRGGMPLGENKAIALRQFRIFGIVPHDRKEQRRHDIRSGTATRRMTTSGFAGRSDAVNAKLRGFVFEGGHEIGWSERRRCHTLVPFSNGGLQSRSFTRNDAMGAEDGG